MNKPPCGDRCPLAEWVDEPPFEDVWSYTEYPYAVTADNQPAWTEGMWQ